MNEALYPPAFIALTLLLYLPAICARLFWDFKKHLLAQLAFLVIYNLTMMNLLSNFIEKGYFPLLGETDDQTLTSWASFMIVAYTFTFVLPEKASKWLLKKKNQTTTLFVDTVPKPVTTNTRRKQITDLLLFFKVLFFSFLYTIKLLLLIHHFTELDALPLLATLVTLFIVMFINLYSDKHLKFTLYP